MVSRMPEIEDKVRTVLTEMFPIYKSGHSVVAVSRREIVEDAMELFIGYYSSPRLFTTGFNLQISGNLGYVLTFLIDEGLRRRGYGRQLYEAVKILCKEQGCTHLRLAPSGDGTEFWPAMSFRKHNEDELEARI